MNKKRMANIEALRLLAMMMVVSLHYLGKGAILEGMTGPFTAKGRVAWLLESFSIVAVDVYMLISGYFMVKARFRVRRVISLVLQVLFYTCTIPAVMILIGAIRFENLTPYDIWQNLFPIQMRQYWFVSAYLMTVLFSPVLNAGILALKKEQLQAVIALLLFVESFAKSVIPMRLAMDVDGYDALWFMTVYLIAAYIRLYGIPFLEKKSRAAVCYVISCLGVYAMLIFIRKLYFATGKFQDFMTAPIAYNHLFTLAASVSLFYLFRGLEFGEQESRLSAFICKISPYSLGVYLLHEQIQIRFEWPSWAWARKCVSVGTLFQYWSLAIVFVMVCGLTVDYVRSLLFQGAAKLLAGSRLDLVLQKLDDRING